MTSAQEDKKLIEDYLRGGEQSLDFLIAKYLKPIYSFSYRNVGNPNDAEDITQETFLKIWKNIKKFDTKKSFKPWLFQIAKNTSIDFLRKKKSIPFSKFENEKGQNILVENLVAAPMNLIENLNNKKVLALAMQNLGEKEQKIINLRHGQGLSFKEISRIFDESINTIKSRYRRTLFSIRKNLKNSN